MVAVGVGVVVEKADQVGEVLRDDIRVGYGVLPVWK